MSSDAIVIIVVVAVVLVLGLAGLLVSRRVSRRDRLRERFGPEYDRAVAQAGSPKQAEVDLRGRVERRDHIAVRPLSPAQRDRYMQDWRQVQAIFVDSPRAALAQADDLITNALVDRGYPMQDFERQAELISVDHPQVVEHYRQAHGVYVSAQVRPVATDEMRQAFVSYRALFSELVDDGRTDEDDAPSKGDAVPHAPSSSF
ncbi:MAG TPA: hypothetical protein VMS00_09965 [Acidimicrobiales bacterium]|nr:hypothetical protein [Acidimicrobiales bacterium]